jgi:hypothetical protein
MDEHENLQHWCDDATSCHAAVGCGCQPWNAVGYRLLASRDNDEGKDERIASHTARVQADLDELRQRDEDADRRGKAMMDAEVRAQRLRLLHWLANRRTPMSPWRIGRLWDVPRSERRELGQLLNHAWFRREAGGVAISDAGYEVLASERNVRGKGARAEDECDGK